MSKPYHEILRESMRVETDVSNALERKVTVGGASRYYASLEALASTKSRFYGYVNEEQPHLAEAVLRGYRQVLGSMPLETTMCDRLVSKAMHKDASWDFVRGSGISARVLPTANVFRLSWASVLPPQFTALARAIDEGDAAANLWPIGCLFRVGTDEGNRRLSKLAAQALEGMNPADTVRDAFAQQYERIREACLVTLNARDPQRDDSVEVDHLGEGGEVLARERQRG